jgi:hypothetical protein
MRLTPEQRDEVADHRSEARPTRRATVPALEEILYEPGAGSRVHPRRRLHGRRCGRGAGGPRLLWARHPQGQRGPGANQLLDAPPS